MLDMEKAEDRAEFAKLVARLKYFELLQLRLSGIRLGIRLFQLLNPDFVDHKSNG